MTTGRIEAVALQALVVLALGPLLVGVIRKVRALLEGRAGASVLQPWRDLRKLIGKERIAPAHSSWVFSLAPPVLIATTLTVSVVVPLVTTAAPLDAVGDLFAVVSLLLVGAVVLALSGLDPGTAFGGMGASREMTIAALAEPTLLVAAFALALRAGSTNLAAIVRVPLNHPRTVLSAPSLLALVALLVAALAETARLPVDNPSTHLELTMVHEAMVLEYAGPDLALVELASALRLTLFFGLIVNLFVPWGIARDTAVGGLMLGALAWSGKVLAIGVLLSTFEVFTAKVRLFRVPELLAASFTVSVIAVTTAAFVGVNV